VCGSGSPSFAIYAGLVLVAGGLSGGGNARDVGAGVFGALTGAAAAQQRQLRVLILNTLQRDHAPLVGLNQHNVFCCTPQGTGIGWVLLARKRRRR